MARVPAFAGIDLVEVEDLLAAFQGFEVLRAEVVPTPVHDHGSGSPEGTWTAALLVARRPA